MSGYVQIISTTATKEDAMAIAQGLVELRLAACVQIAGPITSYYRWDGQITTGEEWQITVKTKAAFYNDVENAISHLHKYDVPEIIAVPVLDGSASYIRWLEHELSSATPPSDEPL